MQALFKDVRIIIIAGDADDDAMQGQNATGASGPLFTLHIGGRKGHALRELSEDPATGVFSASAGAGKLGGALAARGGRAAKVVRRKTLLAAIQIVLEGSLPALLAGMTTPDMDREMPPPTLTARQAMVLGLLCDGHPNKEIALRLQLSEKTVKAHISLIFRALGVINRTQAVNAAHRIGLVARS